MAQANPGLPIIALLGLGLMALWNLFHFIPSLALTVRRLHDTGRSGWHFFISFIPIVGPFIILYYMCVNSQSGSNQYGPNPKGDGGPETQVFA